MRAAEGVELLIVDALRGATPGEDENDSAMRVHLDLLSRVSSAQGCTITVLHHAKRSDGKTSAAQLLRGTSAIYDGSGAIFMISAEEQDEPKRVEQTRASQDARGRMIQPFYLGARRCRGGRRAYRWASCVLSNRRADQAAGDPGSQVLRGRVESAPLGGESKVLRLVEKRAGCSKRTLRELAGARRARLTQPWKISSSVGACAGRSAATRLRSSRCKRRGWQAMTRRNVLSCPVSCRVLPPPFRGAVGTRSVRDTRDTLLKDMRGHAPRGTRSDTIPGASRKSRHPRRAAEAPLQAMPPGNGFASSARPRPTTHDALADPGQWYGFIWRHAAL
jgi:hypothetical protein